MGDFDAECEECTGYPAFTGTTGDCDTGSAEVKLLKTDNITGDMGVFLLVCIPTLQNNHPGNPLNPHNAVNPQSSPCNHCHRRCKLLNLTLCMLDNNCKNVIMTQSEIEGTENIWKENEDGDFGGDPTDQKWWWYFEITSHSLPSIGNVEVSFTLSCPLQ